MTRAGCWYFGIFDSIIRCNAPLLELPARLGPALDGKALDVRFQAPLTWSAIPAEVQLTPWLDETGFVTQGRLGAAILIRVRELADFVVHAVSDLVVCHPYPQAPAHAVRHFLLNQILPRLISVREPLVMHASAVVTEHGAIALIGPSGAGKSTLAASFAANGAGTLISDDGILVRLDGRSPRLLGAYACSRLRFDSVAALGLTPQPSAGQPPWAKYVLDAAPDQGSATAPAPIRAFFLLIPAPPEQREITLAPLTGVAAVVALIANAFLLDPSDRNLIRNQFEAAAAMIQTGCPGYSLTYPRRFADLPRVRTRILAALGN